MIFKIHNLEKFNTYIDKNGYLLVLYPEHPNCWKSSSLIFYHRLVMENHLNRYLDKTEIVHHKDENKLNNDINNLELLSNSEHTKKHVEELLEAKGLKPLEDKNCEICNKIYHPNNQYRKYCSVECFRASYRKFKLNDIEFKNILQKLVWEMPISEVCELYEVSGRSIHNWCKKLNIEKPPQGYWIRIENRLE